MKCIWISDFFPRSVCSAIIMHKYQSTVLFTSLWAEYLFSFDNRNVFSFLFSLLSAYSPPRSAEKWAAICYRFIWWRFMQMTDDLLRLNFFFRRPVLVVWSSLGDDCRPERPLHQNFHFARDTAEKILTKMYSIESVNKTFFVVLLLQTGKWVLVPSFHQILALKWINRLRF